DAFAGQLFDLRERETIDVDQRVMRFHAHFHQIDQVRSAAEKFCVRFRSNARKGFIWIGNARIGEWIHTLPLASLIAARIFGYAPHRQMLPLMNSRISSSLLA